MFCLSVVVVVFFWGGGGELCFDYIDHGSSDAFTFLKFLFI